MTNDYLDIDIDHTLQLNPDNLVGQRIAVLGVSGSGKSNTTAVLLEEALERGIPLTIVDMEGEYLSLTARYPLVIAGRKPADIDEHDGPAIDLEIRLDQAKQLAELSFTRPVSLILDLSDFDLEEANAFLLSYFQQLWKLIRVKRRPYMVVMEEASELIPQSGGDAALKSIIKTLAARGRKKGLTLVVINQRATNIEKNILTQATMLFLHYVSYPTDIKVYQEIIPLPSREVESMVRNLAPGDALFYFNRKVQLIHVRTRHTFHSASTPGLRDGENHQAHQVDEKLLDELRAALGIKGSYRAQLSHLMTIRDTPLISVTDERRCEICGVDISDRRADARTCSDAHRKALERREKAKLN